MRKRLGHDIPYFKITCLTKADHFLYGMLKLFIASGGADSPRQVEVRLAKDGKWYLWEQFLLSDIRQPESANPWA